MVSNDQYQSRRQALLEQIDGLCLVFANTTSVRNSDVEYIFRQDSDFFYLTGFEEPSAALLLDSMAPEGEKVTLFLRERDPEMEIWDGFRLGVERAPSALNVDKAAPIDELESELVARLPSRPNLYYTIGFPQRGTQDELVVGAITKVNRRRKSNASVSSMVSLAPIIGEMRMLKSVSEIAIMQAAADLTTLGHRKAMSIASPGLREYQLQHAMEYEWLSRGSQRNAYPSIVGSGPNACILHYRAGSRICEEGELVLIDAGCELDGYASDVTRTWPISGTFTESQRAIYEVVLKAQIGAIEKCRVGYSYEDVHNEAVRLLVEGLIKLALLDGTVESCIEDKTYRRFYMHGTGHWIGMDVHDVGPTEVKGSPRLFQSGMALTVEPGIYIAPDDESVSEQYRGIGIRIEDDVVITDGDPLILTADIPKTIEDIEALLGSECTPAGS